MVKLKKLSLVLCAGILALAMLASCGGPELIGIIPAYIGEEITTTTHEFTNDEFLVLANYADGTDEYITDFEIIVEGMQEGYYVVTIRYEDQENPCYIPTQLDIYPSDHNG